MRRNNCGCERERSRGRNNINRFDFDNDCGCPRERERECCVKPIRKHLEPVLVARIFNQPIIEEIPCSGMSMTLDNDSHVSNVHSHVPPICRDDCDNDFGRFNDDCKCR